ncbi:hypothetical protein BV25DRAFT_1375670 [Artomyces pyxidatus]|uniref:Uncharacterized protein n=1 Tax=Artomyces pyxidatus TaxID=48021 RepID=A0ACB8TCM2_9AGAM|nr:hypothetical protein BV25DRAFT_1375670 [Artomyces pyxidatus]
MLPSIQPARVHGPRCRAKGGRSARLSLSDIKGRYRIPRRPCLRRPHLGATNYSTANSVDDAASTSGDLCVGGNKVCRKRQGVGSIMRSIGKCDEISRPRASCSASAVAVRIDLCSKGREIESSARRRCYARLLPLAGFPQVRGTSSPRVP